MLTLFIINSPTDGTERVYNALRLAHALIRKGSAPEMTIFLMADAVLAAMAVPAEGGMGAKAPSGAGRQRKRSIRSLHSSRTSCPAPRRGGWLGRTYRQQSSFRPLTKNGAEAPSGAQPTPSKGS
ncbi:MAG: DsrE family protein [Hyphomicrobium sp.]|jgi:hypothetical protein